MSKVFLNSLPKSGTHLAGKLLELMGVKFSNVNFSSSTIYGRYALPKSILRGTSLGQPGIDVGLDISAVARISWMEKSLQQVKSGTYCGGHAPYSDALCTLLKDNDFKTIHIVRDPRDVLLSWVHYVPKNNWHYGCEGLKNLSFDEQVRKVLYGYQSRGFRLESFSSILSRASGWLRRQDVLLTRFEELVGVKGGGNDQQQVQNIQSIVKFIGVQNIDTNFLADNLFGGTKVFRKGQIGAWKDELPTYLIDEINGNIEKHIIQTGYDL